MGMMRIWLIAMCALGAICTAAEDAVSLLCPAVKGEKKDKRELALIKSLKDEKKGIDAPDKAGQTALMLAAALDNRLAVAYLVARGADVSCADKAGKTAMDYAVSPPVRELLSVCKVTNATVLHEDKQKKLREMGLEEPATRVSRVKTLAQANKLKELSEVLKLGVDLAEQDILDINCTFAPAPEALALLIRRGYGMLDSFEGKASLPRNLHSAKLALALGMQPTEKEAFEAALLSDDVSTAKKLLAAEPKLATRCTLMSWSPLCMAQSADMVKALTEAGADATAGAPTKEGQLKGSLLREIITRQTAGAREAEVVQALVKAGAAVQDSPHILCLLCSDGSADAATASCLIQAGVSPDEAEDDGTTALHYAAVRGKAATVKTLVEHKADPNAMNANGDTPLLFLLKNNAKLNPSGVGLAETIKALIKAGADPKTKTREGQNAAQLAKSLGQDNLSKIIKKATK